MMQGKWAWCVAFVLATPACWPYGDATPGGQSNAATGTPDSDSGSAGADGDVEPLPETAFVFARSVRKGVDHIFAYDTATSQEREISALDDDGNHGTSLAGSIRLSPDRKRVAFIGIFRVVAADGYTVGDGSAVWTVTVDGQSFRRQTPSLPKPTDDGCTMQYLDPHCFAGYVCSVELHHCFPQDFSVERRSPSFTPDGNEVWFGFGQYWWDGASEMLVGGTSLAHVTTDKGEEPDLITPTGCQISSDPAVSPDGTLVAYVRDLCYKTPGGIIIMDRATKKDVKVLTGIPLGAGPEWGPSGTSVFTASNDGHGLREQGLDGTERWIIEPTNTSLHIENVTVAPDGTHMVVGTSLDHAGSTTRTWDLVLVERGGKVTQLTKDGHSYTPSWR
jgi:Tol biopolymer transport system component